MEINLFKYQTNSEMLRAENKTINTSIFTPPQLDVGLRRCTHGVVASGVASSVPAFAGSGTGSGIGQAPARYRQAGTSAGANATAARIAAGEMGLLPSSRAEALAARAARQAKSPNPEIVHRPGLARIDYCRVRLSLLQISPPMTQPESDSVPPFAVALPL